MYIKKIRLRNFRNYEDEEFEFENKFPLFKNVDKVIKMYN